MGILMIMPAGPMPKLVLAAAIPLGAFVNVFTFLLKAINFMRLSSTDLHDDEAAATLAQEIAAADEADDILYGSSLSIEAVQASLPSVSYEMLETLDFGDAHRSPLISTCAVCLSEINRAEEVRLLPHCRHLYHTSCINSWLRCNHRTCPLCRASLLLDRRPRYTAYPRESVVLRRTSFQQDEEDSTHAG